jgi:hypothetical protein
VRLTACQCGFARSEADGISEVRLASRAPGPEPPRESALGWLLWAAVGVASLAAGAWVAVKSPPPDHADTELARRFRSARAVEPPPTIVGPPVILRADGPVRRAAEPPDGVSRPLFAPQAPVPAASPESPSPPAPAPVEERESEMDARRRLGADEFNRYMAALSGKADQVDVVWQQFREGCGAGLVAPSASSVAADRAWLAFIGSGIDTRTWTETCAEAGTLFALVRQVREGVCVAEDRARQSWVYPGVRRDLRHAYRLDWEGWERECR